jgi:hypothetical protein
MKISRSIILSLMIPFILIADEKDSSTSLKIEGTPGTKFMGICASADSPQQQRKIEGVVPAEIDLNINLQKCSIKSEGKSGKIIVRLFQNRRLIHQDQMDAPFAGIEFSIPLGKSKPSRAR